MHRASGRSNTDVRITMHILKKTTTVGTPRSNGRDAIETIKPLKMDELTEDVAEASIVSMEKIEL